MNIYGTKNPDVLIGTPGDDVILGGAGKSKQVNLDQLMISKSTTAKVTFQNETADYQNSVGVYKIAADGSIHDVQIMFSNASLQGSGGDLVSGQSGYDLSLNAGEKLGFFLVPNAAAQAGNGNLLADKTGSFVFFNWLGELGNVNSPTELTLVHISADGSTYTEIHSQNWTSLVHSTQGGQGALNGDGLVHAIGTLDPATGQVTVKFEDTIGNSDRNFGDAVFTIDLGVENGSELEIIPSKPATEADNDTLSGGDGNDYIFGQRGNDILSGGNGNDFLKGGTGNDTLDGGAGNDVIKGGKGDDLILASTGEDVISGGKGFDTISFANATNGVSVNLNSHVATGYGVDKISGVEGIIGSSFADTLTGDKKDNVIDGGAGNDVLRGLGGADVLTGGEGADTFVWYAKDIVKGNKHLGVDTVTDFGQGDVLDLHNLFKGDKGSHLDSVKIVDNGTDSMLMAKINGSFVDVAVLHGVTGVTATDLYHEGHLLV